MVKNNNKRLKVWKLWIFVDSPAPSGFPRFVIFLLLRVLGSVWPVKASR